MGKIDDIKSKWEEGQDFFNDVLNGCDKIIRNPIGQLSLLEITQTIKYTIKFVKEAGDDVEQLLKRIDELEGIVRGMNYDIDEIKDTLS